MSIVLQKNFPSKSDKSARFGGMPVVTEGEELMAEMTREMLEAADALEFERAAFLRDQIRKLKNCKTKKKEKRK